MENGTTGLTADDLAFWTQVFRDLLPVAIQAQGWKQGDAPITSGDARVALAADWADRAVVERNARLTQATPGAQS